MSIKRLQNVEITELCTIELGETLQARHKLPDSLTRVLDQPRILGPKRVLNRPW